MLNLKTSVEYSSISSLLTSIDLLSLHTRDLYSLFSPVTIKVSLSSRPSFMRNRTLFLDTESLNYFISRLNWNELHNISLTTAHNISLTTIISNLLQSAPRTPISYVKKPRAPQLKSHKSILYSLTKKINTMFKIKLSRAYSITKNSLNISQSRLGNTPNRLFFRRRKKIM
jgi:hypothetical protein